MTTLVLFFIFALFVCFVADQISAYKQRKENAMKAFYTIKAERELGLSPDLFMKYYDFVKVVRGKKATYKDAYELAVEELRDQKYK